MKTPNRTIKKWLLAILLGMLALPFPTQAFYNPTTGRWLSRDPIAERGGSHLYGFAANDPVNNLDVLGLIHEDDLLASVKMLDETLSIFSCCCPEKPHERHNANVLIAISTRTEGRTAITATASLQKFGCVIAVLGIYWWDCNSAQEEAPRWEMLFGDSWQKYGWSQGGETHTLDHKPSYKPFISEHFDSARWNWHAAVVFSYCGPDGHLHADLHYSNQVEYTWSWWYGRWGNPVIRNG